MTNFQETLKKYANLAINVGVNLQENQTLVIRTPIECADFARLIASEAYDKGAKNVIVKWDDEKLTLIKYLKAPEETLKEFSKFEAEELTALAEDGAAVLSIYASDPEILKPVDPARIAMANKARSMALKKFREYTMSNTISWSIVSIPTEGWAKKVFPDLPIEEAMIKLWENIFKIVRVDEDDPVEAWHNHLKNLKEKMDFLNKKKFKKLYYRSTITDLQIELPKNALWCGGSECNSKGIPFVANMPTEEVFTLPLKTGVNGTVASTKPLNYGGNLINKFTITFKDGKVVDFTAEEGYDTLKELLNTDEGSSYLGEVALVPYNSPISNSHVIFYNTLFDENASCHLALGKAYPSCIENGENMSEDELLNANSNISLVHVDFMIGSKDLNIIGITQNSEEVQVFKDGNFSL